MFRGYLGEPHLLRRLLCSAASALALLKPGQVEADYHYFTSVPSGTDGIVQELRWPYWNNAYYNTWLSDGWTSTEGVSGYLYSGLALPDAGSVGQSRVVNWSFWPLSNPLNTADTITPVWASPNTFSAQTIGEGTIARAPGLWTLWQTNAWYRFAFRVWKPTDGTPHRAYAGQWFRDPSSGFWYHLATVQLPFAATGIDGLMGFQEDATGGLQPQRTDYRNCYCHKSGQWQMANQFEAYSRGQKENAGLIENNTAVYYETCSPANTNYTGTLTNNGQALYLTISNQPATPTFDPIVVLGATAIVFGQQLLVQWQIPPTSSPQLAYQIDVFTNAAFTGTPVAAFYDREPEARQRLLNLAGITTPFPRLSIIDIFDRTNAPLGLVPTNAVLSAGTPVTGAVHGLAYAYYESASNIYSSSNGTNWSVMPPFASLSPALKGVVNDLDLTLRRRRNGYAFNYTGYCNIPSDGLYAFTLNSDAGSKLYIDGQLVVNWDGEHSPSELSGWVGLQAGYHAFNVQYFCDTQPTALFGDTFDTLALSYEGPGISRTLVPPDAYWRIPTAGEPAIILSSPADGATVANSNLALSAAVTPNGAIINNVQFYLGESFWGQDAASPFSVSSFSWVSNDNPFRARLYYNATNTLDSRVNLASTTNTALAPWQFGQLFYHNYPNGASIQGGKNSLIGDGLNLLSRQVNGDCTLVAHLAALPSTAAGPDGSAPDSGWQAGLILRGNTNMIPGYPLGNSSARFAAVFGSVGGGTYFQDDTMMNGGGAYASGDLGGANRWFRIQRAGDTFITLVSANGSSWTPVNTNTLTGIGSVICAGLFSYAQPSHNLNVHWASFDSLSLTGNIVGPPGVSISPASKAAYTGQTVTFAALPSGNPPFFLQWQHNNLNIATATNANLVLTNVQPWDSGLYTILLNNDNGTVSASASLAVLSPQPTPGAVLTNNPVAYWRLNESAGPAAYDSAGNFDGIGEGGIAFGSPGVGPPAFTGFEAGNLAAQFNGSNSDVAIPPLNLNTNALTLLGWVKRNGSQTAWSGLVFCRSGSTTAGLHFGTANELRYTWNNLGSTYNWNSGLIVPDGIWTFVALVIQPSQAVMYLATNGTLYSAANLVANPAQAFAGTAYLGYDPNSSSRRLNGWLDEVAVFNSALTTQQLSRILSASQTTVPSVTMTAPAPGAAYGSPATISLAASVQTNGHAINQVQFYNGSTWLGQSISPPYSFTCSNVAAGTYTLLAQVIYDGSNTAWSPPVTVSVNDLPAAPATLTATPLANNLVSVSWPEAINASGYILSRSGAVLSALAGTNYFDLGLTPNMTYCYSVVATNAWGNSSSSVTNCAITPLSGVARLWDADTTTPGAQDGSGNWGASGSSWWDGSANLAWSDSSLAVFGASSAANANVTITNIVTPSGLLFSAIGGSSYNLSGGGGALSLPGTPTVSVSADAVISAPLAGGGFNKTGPATLTLTQPNTNNGPVTVTAGKLLSTVSCWYSPRGIGAGNLIVNSGATAEFTQAHGFGADAAGRSAVLNGGSLQFDRENYVSGLTLAGGSLVGAGELRSVNGATYSVTASANQSVVSVVLNFVGANCTFNVASGSSGLDLLAAGDGYGPGGFTKIGTGLMRYTGTATNSGPTSVNGGTLQVDGQLGTNTITVQNTALLSGTGLLGGPATIQNGGALAPGDQGIGRLTFRNALRLSGRTVMELNKNGGGVTNDIAVVTGTLTYGGLLVVTNISTNTLAAGDTFRLFSASAYAGAFTSYSLPSLPGSLAWELSMLPSNGSILIVSRPVLTNFNLLPDGSFTVDGTGQPNRSYALLAASNLVPPVAWWPVATNAADSNGLFNLIDLQATNSPQRFYRTLTR